MEDESLDGLNLVPSTSFSKGGVSTLGPSNSHDHRSIQLSIEETDTILRTLSNEESHEPGLNARMRKRLIEREVQENGYQAGLSMEAILKATSSFSSEEEEGETVDTTDHKSLTIK